MLMRSNFENRAMIRIAHVLFLVLSLAPVTIAATFGTVVEVGGHASDLAVDERRGVIYVANYTGNTVDVVSTSGRSILRSMPVPAQPASLALSPDSRYLVVVHYAAFAEPATSANGITIIDLDNNNSRVHLASDPAPLAVAFGADGMALIMTTGSLMVLNPATASTRVITDIELTAEELPVEFATFPPNIVAASMAASGDGRFIYGFARLGSEDQVFYVSYDVANRAARLFGYTTSPDLGPRTISVAKDGSYVLMGWALLLPRGLLLAQFGDSLGRFDVGSHAIDSTRGLIYAEHPQVTNTSGGTSGDVGDPVLTVRDADNLAVRERIRLPEHLTGKSLLSSDGRVMYSVSQSGLIILPVGSLNETPRVTAAQEDLLFRGSFCDSRTAVQDIEIVNPGGGNTPFALSVTTPGIRVSPDSGVTPARVRVSVDFAAFKNQKGTSTGTIQILSGAAINIPDPIRVLVNNREPDQRGTFINVPGKLVDIIADPGRDRFYVLRQDKNLVLVFDAISLQQIAALRTGNTPWSMAITSNWRFLLVGNDNSQIANLFDLETLAPSQFIEFPIGHYPRWIASSGNAVLAASRVAGPVHTIDQIDIAERIATTLPTLGIFKNEIDADTVLAASPSGARIFIAQKDGTTLVYNAGSDTFTASRKDFESLSGTFAAPSDDRFVVDRYVLNSSLTRIGDLENASGASSGFATIDGVTVRTTSPSASGPGVIQKVDLRSMGGIKPVRTSESPLLNSNAASTSEGFPFSRTLAPLANRSGFVSLSTSGLMFLPQNYDAATEQPRIDRVVNAADFEEPVAFGGLITLFGSALGVTTEVSASAPLPTTLADSCLTVNGTLLPLLYVSPGQINAQLPFNTQGSATMILRTPGGVTDGYRLTIRTAAPSVFRSGTAGSQANLATVVRARNNSLVTISNPIHADDDIIIYLTGLGQTLPAVTQGDAAPSDPPASAIILPDVTIGGASIPVSAAELVPGQVGIYQIKAKVPFRGIPTGFDVPLTVTQGGSSNTVPVRVVN